MKLIDLGNSKIAIVCECHYKAVKNMAWHYTGGYAMHTQRIGERKDNKIRHITMQSVIMGVAPKGLQIDHINRNKLDNQCSNLRHVTISENIRNRGWNNPGSRGVDQTSSGKWRLRIRKDGILRHYGTFKTQEEAEQKLVSLEL